jgi:hypothetical protein
VCGLVFSADRQEYTLKRGEVFQIAGKNISRALSRCGTPEKLKG